MNKMDGYNYMFHMIKVGLVIVLTITVKSEKAVCIFKELLASTL